MPVKEVSQLRQDYFNLLPFEPAAIPSLVPEETIAEKIRAASQRSKRRDLHDLSEISARPFRRDLTRSLAVLKLWNHGFASAKWTLDVREVFPSLVVMAGLCGYPARP